MLYISQDISNLVSLLFIGRHNALQMFAYSIFIFHKIGVRTKQGAWRTVLTIDYKTFIET